MELFRVEILKLTKQYRGKLTKNDSKFEENFVKKVVDCLFLARSNLLKNFFTNHAQINLQTRKNENHQIVVARSVNLQILADQIINVLEK